MNEVFNFNERKKELRDCPLCNGTRAVPAYVIATGEEIMVKCDLCGGTGKKLFYKDTNELA